MKFYITNCITAELLPNWLLFYFPTGENLESSCSKWLSCRPLALNMLAISIEWCRIEELKE